jgi:hypothetical protein
MIDNANKNEYITIKKCKISNVLTVDAIQKIVKTVFLPKHVQIAHGKNAVAGIICINGRKIISINFYTRDYMH